ncbi:hypothetical protein SLE2022_077280 [Rubroshorea leprosula]
MGHRHLFGTSQMFENEHENSWNHLHTEQHFGNLVRAGTSENGSLFCPAENSNDVHFSSHWNPVARSSGYATSSHIIEGPQYQPDTSGPSHDFFPHPSTAGTFGVAPENYGPSSSYDRQTLHGVEGNFIGLSMSSVRGPHKRKSPGIPAVCEIGSSSQYPGAGSSSDLALSCDPWLEKQTVDSQHMHWDSIGMTPNYRGNGLSIRGEDSMRNVRSRPAIDLESNLVRNHLSHSSHSMSQQPVDYSSSMELSGQASSALTRDWTHSGTSSGHVGLQVSDSNGLNHETNRFLGGGSAANVSLEVGGFNHEFISGRSPLVPQSFHGSTTQSARGVRSNYSQRSTPPVRASSSVRLGHLAPPEDGMQLAVESYPSRHSLPLSATWRNSERSGRQRISGDRYRSLSDDAAFNERFSSEGFMVVDRPAAYGSRNMLDQHRDMRLDIDNMTYEELLALEERIGNVSTGLSEDLISKCLTESVFFELELFQEKETCVICLEEYQDMDRVGAVKTCGHDYHVTCIKKWLSMKNTCPICKASALADGMKEKQ